MSLTNEIMINRTKGNTILEELITSIKYNGHGCTFIVPIDIANEVIAEFYKSGYNNTSMPAISYDYEREHMYIQMWKIDNDIFFSCNSLYNYTVNDFTNFENDDIYIYQDIIEECPKLVNYFNNCTICKFDFDENNNIIIPQDIKYTSNIDDLIDFVMNNITDEEDKLIFLKRFAMNL